MRIKLFLVVMCNKSILALKALSFHALRGEEVFILIFLCLFFVGFNIYFYLCTQLS